jgi:dihydrolipoamide dehydrogenase
MSNKQFDVVVIGAGPGGYIAAIRAAQLGFSVACIDEWSNEAGKPAPGGTCTNVGCIPSKALLQSSEHFEHASHGFKEHGINVEGLSFDVAQMLKRKNTVVKQNNDGILFLFKKNKVTFFHGRGAFAGAAAAEGYPIAISGPTTETITGKQIIVATGSNPRALPGAPFDEKLILSNTGALNIESVPAKLGVIGAGVIGLELGSVWRRLGSEVTVLEGLPTFLGAVDEQIAKEAQKLLTKQGLSINLSCKITKVETANTIGLGADKVGLAVDERGMITVDEDCKTNLPNVWAIGDVVRGPMLAHKAEEEAVAVAERIAGQHGHTNFNTLPSVIYTHPEIASVGKTEQQLKAEGVAYKAGTFPFLANGRARALGDTNGMVKFLSDATTDEILGVHIVGPMASELISEAVVAMEFKASAEDIARICHAHPSLSEATKEAALAVDKRTLNF